MPGLDLVIDPETRDLVDDDDGEFLETESAAPALVGMMLARGNEWWGDPEFGSGVHLALKGGTSASELKTLRDRTLSAMRSLEKAGYIREIRVEVSTVDGLPNRVSLKTFCIDARNGERIELQKLVKIGR